MDLDTVRLDGMPTVSQELELDWDGNLLVCVCHPLGPLPTAPTQEPEREEQTPSGELELLPALVPTPAADAADDRALDKESDSPSRVWRVVPRTQDPTGPAWVVGVLVHAALRRWRFPT